MKRFLLPVLAGVGVILLIAGVAIERMSSRADAVEAVPVALINRDEPVTVGEGDQEQTIAAGRTLAADIVTGTKSPLEWTIIDAEAAGVAETDYYATVTIPENFSAVISGLQDGDVGHATVTLETDDPANPLAAQIARDVTEASTAALNDDVTSTYLETVYESYDSVGAAVDDATAGATELSGSAQQLVAGADELAAGAHDLAAGAQDAAASGQALSTGAATVAGGSASVTDGANSLSASLDDATAAATETLVPLASTAAGQSAEVAESLAALTQRCPPIAGSAYCAAVAAAAQASVTSAQSAAATASTAAGLSSGLATASSASAQLTAGAADVSSGAASLVQGSTELAAALDGLSAGADTIARSSDTVASGAHDVADGAASLTEGLNQLAGSVPTYDESIRVDLADAVASPVRVSTAGASTGGPEAFVAIAAALAIWVGGAAMFVRRPAVPPWALSAGGRATRAVAIGLAPRLGVAALCALTLWTLLATLGSAGSNPGALLILLLLGAVCLTAVLHAIFTATGRAGFLVAGILGLIQVAAAGLFAPIEMAGSSWQTISELMPLSRLVRLLRDIAVDQPIEPLSSTALLAVWLLLAVTISVVATRTRATYRYRTVP